MRAKLIVLLALLVAACGGRQAPSRAGSGMPVELRVPALDGGEIDIRQFRGQIVVVHLFAPNEPSSAADATQLSALHDAGDEGVVVIGVALEPGGYPLVAAWRRGMEVPYLMAMATHASELYSAHLAPLEALPTTLVLDDRGRLAHRVDGPLEPGELESLVGPLRKTGG